MTDYGELRISPTATGHNPVNGRFLKGHVPANKGRKWSEYLPKRMQKRCAKGWANLKKYDGKVHRSPSAGRNKKQVVAVTDDGRFCVFPSLGAAAEWCGGLRENVGRCCRFNQSHKVKQRAWCSRGHGIKGVKKSEGSLVNTDHRYMGVRFYFETDNTWTSKIRE